MTLYPALAQYRGQWASLVLAPDAMVIHALLLEVNQAYAKCLEAPDPDGERLTRFIRLDTILRFSVDFPSLNKSKFEAEMLLENPR